MDDDVEVHLIGGPMDGTRMPAEHDAVHGPDPGAYLVVDDDRNAPDRDPGARAAYEPDPGSDPRVWVFRGWVP